MSATTTEPETLPPCATCRARHTPLTRDAGGAALVCAPGHGCGVGRSLGAALGHVQAARCARGGCPRPPARRGPGTLCEPCLQVDHASRLLGQRGAP